MARWKARVEFLLSVTELIFLSPTAWGATRQNVSKLAASRRLWVSLSQDFKGKGLSLGNIFLVSTNLDTFCYLTVQTAPCYAPSFWHNTGVWQTDRQTDGIAVASTALAMRALRRAVKNVIYGPPATTTWAVVNLCEWGQPVFVPAVRSSGVRHAEIQALIHHVRRSTLHTAPYTYRHIHRHATHTQVPCLHTAVNALVAS